MAAFCNEFRDERITVEPIFFKNRKINEGSGIVLEILPMVLVLPRDKLEFETLRNLIEKPMEKAIADVIASLSKVCKKDVIFSDVGFSLVLFQRESKILFFSYNSLFNLDIDGYLMRKKCRVTYISIGKVLEAFKSRMERKLF